MTKPDDIPQDVWAKSDAVLGEGTAALRDYILSGGDEPDVGIMKPIIARAIMAEREACAQVAQKRWNDWSTDIGGKIAADIRHRGAA